MSLDAKAFRDRHRTLSILLALHVPALIVFGIVRDQGVLHSIAEATPAAVLLGLAQFRAMPRRAKGILVSAGLVWCSAVIVHFSGGMIEAHFHFFVILGFIALYQDWAAFGWTIVFTVVSHGAGSAISPELMFNHQAAIDRPWTWAAIHAGMVLFAAIGQVIGWRHAEVNQRSAMELSTALLREQADRQASYSRIYVNLARRSQSLLHRQLSVIDELEQHEEDPNTLRRLFALDHLTTRVRRNAESLLVVAGEESPRRWTSAVTLADIARAAASEIEQYERTDVRVSDDVAIQGKAVVDITHLLAELIENAAEYSSPETSVVVTGGPQDDGALLTIEDLGIGMSEKDLLAANRVLAEPPELDEEQVRQLGFQVVGRLAQKLGMTVRLRPTVGGSGPRAGAGRKGITAVVEMPRTVLAESAPAPQNPAPAEQAAAEEPVTEAPTPKEPTPEEPTLAEVPPLDGRQREADAPAAGSTADAATEPAPASPPPPPAAARPAAPQDEPEYCPPPAVTIPAQQEPATAHQPPPPAPTPQAPAHQDAPAPAHQDRPAPAPQHTPAPAPSAAPPASGEPSGSMLFVAKEPPSSLSRKGRKARREQRQDVATSPPRQEDRQIAPPPTPSAPTPAVTATPSPTDQATTGGSTIDDIDQLAQYASRLPRRTPGGNLAPGLREPQPDPEPSESSGTSPEARRALSAFQSAARSARRPADESMEHPS